LEDNSTRTTASYAWKVFDGQERAETARDYATRMPLELNLKNDMGRYTTFDEKIPKWDYLTEIGDGPFHFLINPKRY